MSLKDKKAGKGETLKIVMGAEVRVGGRKFTFVINYNNLMMLMVLRRTQCSGQRERDSSGETESSVEVQGVVLRRWKLKVTLTTPTTSAPEAHSCQCWCLWCCAVDSQVGPAKALFWNMPELAKFCKKANGLERKDGGLSQGLLLKVSYAGQ